MVKLTPDETRLRPRFLELYLRSPSGRTQVESAAAGTSASMKKINSAHIKSFSIPLPDPVTQDSVLAQTELLRRTQRDTDSRIAEARMFRRALLDKVLSLQPVKEAAGRG
jgi:type I restriction enzyme S subunit